MFSSFKARWHAPQGYRDVLRVGMPLVAGMVSTTLMQFTDRLFLSHYSVTSIAAALPSAMAALTLQIPFIGLCGYVSVIIAHYIGAGLRHEAGAALWQGIWITLASSILLLAAYPLALPLFHWAGHAPAVIQEEIIYFRGLILGSVFLLAGAAISGFFIGRGITRPVLVATLAGAILNVPLDYALIFGKWGLPEMGIKGAALATVIGWAFTALILGIGVFRKKNDAAYRVFRSWRLRKDMLLRLLRFGVPSGLNLFMEIVGFAWFVLEVGKLGQVPLAASNIALSINTLIFMPMLGLNTAVSTLVGQAMGRKKPAEAETATISALHLSLMYMLPLALLCSLFAGPLMDFFRPQGSVDFAPIRATGIVLIYYIALYSLVDSCNIVLIGALKGAGDTLAVMIILGGTGLFLLILPIAVLKTLNLTSLHTLWITLTTYLMSMALFAYLRYRQRKWRKIRVIKEE